VNADTREDSYDRTEKNRRGYVIVWSALVEMSLSGHVDDLADQGKMYHHSSQSDFLE
jgi:hypothetical protein